jgi:transcriptional accessory protein Tex/SPT6
MPTNLVGVDGSNASISALTFASGLVKDLAEAT